MESKFEIIKMYSVDTEGNLIVKSVVTKLHPHKQVMFQSYDEREAEDILIVLLSNQTQAMKH